MGNQRICIKCGATLRRLLVEEVEVDDCPSCGGLWLDKGEIWQLSEGSTQALEALIAQLNKAAPSQPKGAGAPYRELEISQPPNASPLDTPCPACDGKLALARFGPVQVELCTECDGLYLDRGELDKAVQVMRDRGSALTTIASLAKWVSTRGSIG